MIWVLVAILAIALVAVVVMLMRQRRSQQLREGFGPEYERTIAETGDRRAAENELAERRERRDKLEIRELDPDARDRYAERWRAAQRHFVDQPAAAVAEADRLVAEVMRERGYPVEDDFERRAADVSVDHPVVVENYRAAHAISMRSVHGEASTEDLRQALVHFRALFAELLGGDEARAARRRPGEGGPPMTRTDETLSTRDIASPPAQEETLRDGTDGVDAGARHPSATNAVAAERRTDDDGPLLPEGQGAELQARWEAIQTRFVDDPRSAVEEADALVASTMQQLADGFASAREDLEGQWSRGEDISTEDLRVALQRYRSFFRRLLSA